MNTYPKYRSCELLPLFYLDNPSLVTKFFMEIIPSEGRRGEEVEDRDTDVITLKQKIY